jgi:hypothetical protein
VSAPTVYEVVEATMKSLAELDMFVLGEPTIMEGYGEAWNVAGYEIKTRDLVAAVERKLP